MAQANEAKVPMITYSLMARSSPIVPKRNTDLAAIRKPMALACPLITIRKIRPRSRLPIARPPPGPAHRPAVRQPNPAAAPPAAVTPVVWSLAQTTGVTSFAFADLYTTAGAAAIDRLFLAHLDAADAPLAARLREELWLDRERAGLMSDV